MKLFRLFLHLCIVFNFYFLASLNFETRQLPYALGQEEVDEIDIDIDQELNEMNSVEDETQLLEQEFEELAEDLQPAPPAESPRDALEVAKPEESTEPTELAEPTEPATQTSDANELEEFMLDEELSDSPASTKDLFTSPEPSQEELLDEPQEQQVEVMPEPVPISEPQVEEEEIFVSQPEPVDEPTYTQDEPDEAFEARLQKIYEGMSERMKDEDWFKIAGPKISEVYQVQKGDTLWDISTTLFGDGFFWPKLWQINSSYTNPHSIDPGDQIRFHPGSLTQAPTISIASPIMSGQNLDEPNVNIPVAKEYMEEALAGAEIPPAPPTRPVLKRIPPSLPELDSQGQQYDDLGFEIDTTVKPVKQTQFHVPGYLTNRRPNAGGKVIEIEAGAEYGILYQNIIVEFDEGARVGQVYHTFSVNDDINLFNSHSGYAIDYQAQIEITEDLGDGKFRALIVDQINPVTLGSYVLNGTLPKQIYQTESRHIASFEADVIGGRFDDKRMAMSGLDLIYLAVDSASSVAEGDLLTVYRNPSVRGKSVVEVATQPIGQIQIVNVSGSYASAIVLNSKDAIQPGDKVAPGGAVLSSKNMIPAETEIIDEEIESSELDMGDEELEEIEDLQF